MRTIEQIWNDGRRAYVMECLARDEFPFKGWDKKYPDLAEERMREVRVSCQRCGATLTSADRPRETDVLNAEKESDSNDQPRNRQLHRPLSVGSRGRPARSRLPCVGGDDTGSRGSQIGAGNDSIR